MTEAEEKQIMTHTFQLMGGEIDSFNEAFKISGFRSKSEFIRFLLFAGIKDYYGDKE